MTYIVNEKCIKCKLTDCVDVANVVLFLSSELSDYITGETIHVNGGMYFS